MMSGVHIIVAMVCVLWTLIFIVVPAGARLGEFFARVSQIGGWFSDDNN